MTKESIMCFLPKQTKSWHYPTPTIWYLYDEDEKAAKNWLNGNWPVIHDDLSIPERKWYMQSPMMELMWLTVRGSRPLEASSLNADITLKAEKSTTLNKETEKCMIYIRCAVPDLLIQQIEHFRNLKPQVPWEFRCWNIRWCWHVCRHDSDG